MAKKLQEIVVETQQYNGAYTIEELSYHAKKIFDVSPDIVTAALRKHGAAVWQVADAKKAIDNFLKGEVKA
jgi:hypothetical protein